MPFRNDPESALRMLRGTVVKYRAPIHPVGSDEWGDVGVTLATDAPVPAGATGGCRGAIPQATEASLPTISTFFGITIQMFWADHAPPHFHALYGEHEALIDIRTLEVIRGSLPGRVLGLTLEWAAMHRQELLSDWHLCANRQPPAKIPPLE